MADQRSFYVYGYFDDSGVPLYIGKGTGRRERMHIWEARSGSQTYWHRKLRKMLDAEEPFESRRIKEGLTHKEACKIEAGLIAEFGRRSVDEGGILYNILDGGVGASPEDIRRMFDNDEVKAKHAASIRAFSQKKSWRKKVSDAVKKAVSNPESIERLSAASNKRWGKEGSREGHSIAMKDWFSDDENKARHMAAIKKLGDDPDFVRKQAEATRKNWSDKSFRERHAASNRESWRSESRRARHSEIMKEKWKDPEYRRAVMEGRRRRGAQNG